MLSLTAISPRSSDPPPDMGAAVEQLSLSGILLGAVFHVMFITAMVTFVACWATAVGTFCVFAFDLGYHGSKAFGVGSMAKV